MNATKAVLYQTMLSRIEYQCSTDKLVVFGYYVRLSKVVEIECMQRVKFIEIFALNRVFIDADIDKTGQKIQLTIVAYEWQIINNRKIILNGVSAKQNDSNEVKLFSKDGDGKPGLPGRPGGTAGNFVGIGGIFINDHSLEIHANGGKGGPGERGQDGDESKDAIHDVMLTLKSTLHCHVGSDGEEEKVPITNRSIDATDAWKNARFKFKLVELTAHDIWPDTNELKLVFTNYTVWKKILDKEPGGGGNGGAGGIGGNITFIYLFILFI